MDDSNDSKKADNAQDVNKPITKKNIDTSLTPRLPTPRKFEGKEYYGASDVAKIIGVGRTTVLFWHQKELFTADLRTHDGVYKAKRLAFYKPSCYNFFMNISQHRLQV